MSSKACSSLQSYCTTLWESIIASEKRDRHNSVLICKPAGKFTVNHFHNVENDVIRSCSPFLKFILSFCSAWFASVWTPNGFVFSSINTARYVTFLLALAEVKTLVCSAWVHSGALIPLPTAQGFIPALGAVSLFPIWPQDAVSSPAQPCTPPSQALLSWPTPNHTTLPIQVPSPGRILPPPSAPRPPSPGNPRW